ncbi:hypothetical protein DRN75_03295 [Nanoarchaeota archaeon]|nr:MAG: hypothetical protein DRN75_03295 [Nanoarchaeota archaeon]
MMKLTLHPGVDPKPLFLGPYLQCPKLTPLPVPALLQWKVLHRTWHLAKWSVWLGASCVYGWVR